MSAKVKGGGCSSFFYDCHSNTAQTCLAVAAARDSSFLWVSWVTEVLDDWYDFVLWSSSDDVLDVSCHNGALIHVADFPRLKSSRPLPVPCPIQSNVFCRHGMSCTPAGKTELTIGEATHVTSSFDFWSETPLARLAAVRRVLGFEPRATSTFETFSISCGLELPAPHPSPLWVPV